MAKYAFIKFFVPEDDGEIEHVAVLSEDDLRKKVRLDGEALSNGFVDRHDLAVVHRVSLTENTPLTLTKVTVGKFDENDYADETWAYVAPDGTQYGQAALRIDGTV